jgi:disulfide bond formation protein DsbB
MSTPPFHFNYQKILIKNTTGNKMKKIILTIILSSFLSAIAVAGDHVMRNDNPNASVMAGKHMMNKNPNASVMEGKHMMSDNPFSSHSKDDAGAAKTNKKTNKGYTVIKYKK